MDPFMYSAKFRSRIARLHRGKESWPHYREYLAAHLGGPGGRLIDFVERLVPEIEHHCAPLAGRRVLDLGCGTGATTVALALAGARVTAFDVDPESVGIARLRLAEHGLEAQVFVWCGRSTDELAPSSFELVLMNGVLEHVPLSVPGLRREVVRAAWRRVAPGGGLYVSDTPNRLWPRDGHSTGLWFLPWAPPGSAWAYRRAVESGRHSDAPTLARGPRGLEEAGAWGATYWELRRYLDGEKVECVNLEPGHDERLSHTGRRSPRRRLLEGLLYHTAVRALRFRDRFEPGTNFKAWIYTILTHTFIHRYRRQKREREILEGTTRDDVDRQLLSERARGEAMAPEASYLEHLLSDDVIRALDGLPEEFRTVVTLCDLEGLSYKEIADAVGVPVGTVMSRLFRGRRQLEKKLRRLAIERGIIKATPEDLQTPSPEVPVLDLSVYRRRKDA